jgi:peroxiredoxin
VQRFSNQVRVVQVLTDNASRTGITPEFCDTWSSRYGFTNVKLVMDPMRRIYRIFTAGQTGTVTISLPAMVIIDRAGTIRWVKNGASLTEAQAQLENVLAEP